MSWNANKIDRVTRSPGPAETIAVVNGEDILFHARHEWGELMGSNGTNVFDVRLLTGCPGHWFPTREMCMTNFRGTSH